MSEGTPRGWFCLEERPSKRTMLQAASALRRASDKPESGCLLEWPDGWSWSLQGITYQLHVRSLIRYWCLDEDLHYICLIRGLQILLPRKRTYRCWCLREDLQMLMPRERASEADASDEDLGFQWQALVSAGLQTGKRRSWCLEDKDFDSATLIVAWVRYWCLEEDLHYISLVRGLQMLMPRKRTFRCWCLKEDLQMLMPR